jgi:uncharacterized protein YbbC (DUF1343 family)
MSSAPRILNLGRLTLLAVLGLCGCHANQPAAIPKAVPVAPVAPRPPLSVSIPTVAVPRDVRLGIDILEAGNFITLKGKRVGLLTHPAGVDRRGVSTIDLIRRAPGVQLVALFATEHSIYGNVPAGKIFPDRFDSKTGLTVYSLYNGRSHRPTRSQLKGIDALVVDLQDIGVRSYTFAGAMEQAMEGCFENNVEVIVLDRPNPLGGLKVDGPPMDPQWLGSNLVNAFPVPYVHGLTIGELALLAKGTPGVLRISEAARTRGRLIVIPMSGWRRSMRWPETGLPWIPTSPFIPDFAAVVGYPMTGLGCQLGTFTNGIGSQYPFRGIYHPSVKLDVLERELAALHLPGLQFRRVSVPNSRTGQPASGIYLEVTDWDEWRPTDLNFYLMRLACKLEPRNPFAAASRGTAEGFLRIMGSTAFFRDLAAHGARVDVASYIQAWEAEDRNFQQESRRFWLYQ